MLFHDLEMIVGQISYVEVIIGLQIKNRIDLIFLKDLKISNYTKYITWGRGMRPHTIGDLSDQSLNLNSDLNLHFYTDY